MSGFLRANYPRGRVCTSAKGALSQKLRLLQPDHGNDVPSLLPYAIGHTDQGRVWEGTAQECKVRIIEGYLGV